MTTHKHHIIPKHEWRKRFGDLIWLSGQIGREELQKEIGKRAGILNKGRKHSLDWKQDMSTKNSGSGNPMHGKFHSDATKFLMSEKRKGRPHVVTTSMWKILTPSGDLIQTQNIAEFCRTHDLRHSGISWSYHNKKSYKGFRVERQVL